MDAIKAAFESQFGTEWSAPVTNSKPEQENTGQPSENSENASEEEEVQPAKPKKTKASKKSRAKQPAEESSDEEYKFDNLSDSDASDGPITVTHDDNILNTSQPIMTKSQRRKFMTSGAPGDDTQLMGGNTNTEGEKSEDLKNDLELQRLIEESHILHEGQQYSGADISGATDPMDTIGKSRLKVMNARLSKAGAKQKTARIPQAMSVGIRDKAAERQRKYKEEARNAGIIIAKDRHAKSKNTTRDKGLKINSVGKASQYGIHVSAADIARLTSKGKPKGKKGRK